MLKSEEEEVIQEIIDCRIRTLKREIDDMKKKINELTVEIEQMKV